MKKTLTILIILLVVIFGIYLLSKDDTTSVTMVDDTNLETTTETTTTDTEMVMEEERSPIEVIGQTVEGRDITAYHYGEGEKEILFVGGIHGGYSPNTALVAYQLMDYLETNPTVVPEGVMVTVVPALNADGLTAATGVEGRFTAADVSTSEATRVASSFNANGVDLNRNFDCDWKASATWQTKTVSGGTAALSEPEASAISTYITAHEPVLTVAWYSAAGGVFSSACHNGVLPETTALTNLYAQASGYPAYEEFDFYEVTGDMVNWVAKNGLPSISVLLTDHTNTEWEKNRAGILALLKHFAN